MDTTVNNAAVNTGVQVPVGVPVFISFGSIPTSGVTDNSVTLFEELTNCFPQQLCYFIFPPAVYESSNFSTSSPTLATFLFSFFLFEK